MQLPEVHPQESLFLLARRYDNTSTKESPQERLMPGFVRASDLATLCLTGTKISDSQKERGVHQKTHCLYKQFRLRELLLPVWRMIGTLSKSKFPDTSQGHPSKQAFIRRGASGPLAKFFLPKRLSGKKKGYQDKKHRWFNSILSSTVFCTKWAREKSEL